MPEIRLTKPLCYPLHDKTRNITVNYLRNTHRSFYCTKNLLHRLSDTWHDLSYAWIVSEALQRAIKSNNEFQKFITAIFQFDSRRKASVCNYKSQENELGRTCYKLLFGRNKSFKKILYITEVYTFDSVTTTKWIRRYKGEPSFLKWQSWKRWRKDKYLRQ